MKYTIAQFNAEFPDEEACVDNIFKRRYGDLKKCPKCEKSTTFYRVKNRKSYACQFCGHQLYPLADTIFHKSPTPLKLWFYAIFLFSTSKNGVSAKELQRQLGVTYKTAWRMAQQIRNLMAQDNDKLSGTVEADETYVGGRGRKTGRGTSKQAVFGVVERKGKIKTALTQKVDGATLTKLISENVSPDTTIMTDDWQGYKWLKRSYPHNVVRHGRKEYVRGNVHTNTIENFWFQFKTSVKGTHHSISKKYMQKYLNEFAWRYNVRNEATPLFALLLSQVVKPA